MKENKFRAYSTVTEEMIPSYSLAFDYYEPLCDQLKGSDELIIMQYTNIKDINGTEVYEKDIVKVQIEGCLQSKPQLVNNIWDIHLWLNDSDHYYGVQKVEVVGNLYETPNIEYINLDDGW